MLDARNHPPVVVALAPPPVGRSVAATLGLADLGERAAEVLSILGWTQGAQRDAMGRACLHGALDLAVTERGQLVDAPLLTSLFNARGFTTRWNDVPGRTSSEVMAALTDPPITDEECAALWGPQWAALVVLLRAAGGLPDVMGARLDDAAATLSEAGFTARDHLGVPLHHAGADAGAADGLWAARASILASQALAHWRRRTARLDESAWSVPAQFVVSVAATALALRHLLPATMYCAATLPWRRAVGPIHPDDAPPVAGLAPGAVAALLAGDRVEVSPRLFGFFALHPPVSVPTPSPVARFLVRAGDV